MESVSGDRFRRLKFMKFSDHAPIYRKPRDGYEFELCQSFMFMLLNECLIVLISNVVTE